MKNLIVRDELHKELKEYCKIRGYSLKGIVEKLIRQELDRNK